ncbi:unnamed protein product [Didymodactylos carnosus]|uniref:EF-hand domain-containing protein n=1 Tax=Didymodactylos carnosus TaxID=1234261 RepID=A0A813S0N7_9BILA|nr:unnamed protein product [Didymodactylos carnosus]CAF0895891.1 unnamed protein product [Didymodactylos carnosus]CAF3576621.1 unnamed protein product [Didymodactylos carnosus]CAF3677381.1 unnamed protein product [Didymodactylos carnosus]
MINCEQRYPNGEYLQMSLLDSIDNSGIKDDSSDIYYSNNSSLIFSSFDDTSFKLEQEEEFYSKSERTATFTLCSDSDSESSAPSSVSNILLENEKIPKYQLRHSLSFTNNTTEHKIDENYLYPTRIVDDIMITTTGKSRRELSAVHGFSEEQIAVFEESFSVLDRDRDGHISDYEIRSLMNSLGYSPSEEDIGEVIKKVDLDGNGKVDFEEFLTMMQRRKSAGELDHELKHVFDVFDKNRDGFIDKDELYDMLKRLGENITEEDVIDMIDEADTDEDNKVSYEEFKAILYSK